MSSYLSEIFDRLTDNHQLDPIVDRCKVNTNCSLKSGHEVTFISLIAHKIFQILQDQSDEELKYQNWVYMPSRRAESKVGYDLSIGKYDDPFRVRSMHKLLLSWCDNRRSWTLSPSKTSDYQHLLALFRDYVEDQIYPYLILHICFCIHDYRRMGLDIDDYKYGQLEIPDFDNPLRLVIVSLNELFTYLKEMNFDPNNPNRIVKFRYKRSIRKKNDDESVPEYWNRIVSIGNHTAIAEISELDIIELPILDFDNWTTFLVNNLQEDHT